MNEANPPQQVLVYPQYPDRAEDEISLFDLWQGLVKQKKAILGTTAIVTLIALLYALLTTPIYKAETVFLPPSSNDIQILKVKDLKYLSDLKDLIGVNTDIVYSLFKINLGSISLRKRLFDEMNLADQFEPDRDKTQENNEIFEKFNKNIGLAIATTKKEQFLLPTTTLSLEGRNPELIAEIVNRLAQNAQQETINQLISDLMAKVSERIKEIKSEINLLLNKTKNERLDKIERLESIDSLERNKIQDKINTLRFSAKNKRLDRINQLMEASAIARSLGIEDPIDYKLKKISNSATTNSQIMTDISNKSSQLYTQGYEALDAEIVSLKKRINDDPYINELRTLEEELKLLEHNRIVEQLKNRKNDAPFIKELREKENILAYFKNIMINPELIKVAHLDHAAFPPEKKIKPKRALIVVLGLVLGLILGVLVAFFRNIQAKQENGTLTPNP